MGQQNIFRFALAAFVLNSAVLLNGCTSSKHRDRAPDSEQQLSERPGPFGKCVIALQKILGPKSLYDPFSELENAQRRVNKSNPNWSQRYQQFEEELAQKYSSLEFLLEDSAAFQKEMSRRFQVQKSLNAEDPREFSFKEIGIPLVQDMKTWIRPKIEEIEKRRLRKWDPRDKAAFDTAKKWAADLESEMDEILARGDISYKRSIELAYFTTRFLGHFDSRGQSPFMRFSLTHDRIANGFRSYSIKEEYQAYTSNNFNVFLGPSPVKNYTISDPVFQEAWENLDELETIILPTSASLGYDVFYNLMPRGIYPIGVADKPILADGTLRPASDFWNHDIRHSSLMFTKLRDFKKNILKSEEQFEQLRKKIGEWRMELNELVEAIPHEGLKSSIKLTSFNLHHERGYMMIPSTYLNAKEEEMVFITRALAFQMKAAGELSKDLNLDIQAGYQFLKAFYATKIDEERAIIGTIGPDS